MPTTGEAVQQAVLSILQEPSPENPISSLQAIRREINEVSSLLCTKDYLGLGEAWVRPLFSLVAGDDEYLLPFAGGVEYEQVLDLRYDSDNVELVRCSYEHISAHRTGTPLASGRPTHLCLREGAVNREVTILVYPVPLAAEAVNGLVSLTPVPWEDGDDTAPAIPFSKRSSMALAKLVAANIAKTLGREKLTALDLAPNCWDGWIASAMEMVRTERLRIIRLKRSHGARNYAWVSRWAAE
jgi:hypothetical protein